MKGLSRCLTMTQAVDRTSDRDRWCGTTWKLVHDMQYKTKANEVLQVPAGFICNLATWLQPSGSYVEAAVMHDYLYSIGRNRKEADDIFMEMMQRGGVKKAVRKLFYLAVRIFGRRAYNRALKALSAKEGNSDGQ